MSEIDERVLEILEKRLGQRRAELRELIHDALVESRREDYRELAGAVHDAGDESVADLLEGLSHAALNREVAELADTEAALARLRNGQYGICVDCGDPIRAERLQAYLTAKRCLTCQARHESQRRGGADVTPSL